MSLDSILAKAREWEARRVRDGSIDEGVRRHVARMVEPFLGQGAVGRVVPAAGESSHLLAEVERTLAIFLGAKAASAVVTRAMDRVTVRS